MSCGDGAHSLLDVAERAELPFDAVFEAAVALEEANLLRRESLQLDDRIGATP
jgi:aminopeptidase-like protein